MRGPACLILLFSSRSTLYCLRRKQTRGKKTIAVMFGINKATTVFSVHLFFVVVFLFNYFYTSVTPGDMPKITWFP